MTCSLISECNAQVKRSYMKANLVVHPDKVKQKGGTVEQVPQTLKWSMLQIPTLAPWWPCLNAARLQFHLRLDLLTGGRRRHCLRRVEGCLGPV